MSEKILEDLYKVKQFDLQQLEHTPSSGRITEKDKLIAAKQILLGLALLYVYTLLFYVINPSQEGKLLDICTTTFPPLATLILVSYFRDKQH